MRMLVTGARGKVGSRVVDAARAAGHKVTATDIGAPVYGMPAPGQAPYVRADLTDYGQAIATVQRAQPDVIRTRRSCRWSRADTAGHEIVAGG